MLEHAGRSCLSFLSIDTRPVEHQRFLKVELEGRVCDERMGVDGETSGVKEKIRCAKVQFECHDNAMKAKKHVCIWKRVTCIKNKDYPPVTEPSIRQNTERW